MLNVDLYQTSSRRHYHRTQATSSLPMDLFVLFSLQVILGGWTSANYAALVCPIFPPAKANGGLLHFGEGFSIPPIGSNYEGGLLSGAALPSLFSPNRRTLCALAIGKLCQLTWKNRQSLPKNPIQYPDNVCTSHWTNTTWHRQRPTNPAYRHSCRTQFRSLINLTQLITNTSLSPLLFLLEIILYGAKKFRIAPDNVPPHST